jgi:hypothetical protein
MDLEYSDEWSLTDHRYPLAGGVAGQRRTEPFTGHRVGGDVIEMGHCRQNPNNGECCYYGPDNAYFSPAPPGWIDKYNLRTRLAGGAM